MHLIIGTLSQILKIAFTADPLLAVETGQLIRFFLSEGGELITRKHTLMPAA